MIVGGGRGGLDARYDNADALFIGPSDLAADMGHIGNAAHPEVRVVTLPENGHLVIEARKAAGKTPAYLPSFLVAAILAIVSAAGRVLGTFGTYFLETREPIGQTSGWSTDGT